MSLYRRVIALCTCLLLLAAAFSALAEETDPVMTAEEAEAAGIEVEGIATEDEELEAFLFSLGCYSGEPITVVSRLKNSCVGSIKDGRYNIDHQLADAIIV